jgi:hypothetical protein
MKLWMPTRRLPHGRKLNTTSRSSDFVPIMVENTPATISQSISRTKEWSDDLQLVIRLSITALLNHSITGFSSASVLSYITHSSQVPYGVKQSCSPYGSRIIHRHEHLATLHLMSGFTRASPISVECPNGGRRFGYTAQADQNSMRGQLKGTGWGLTVIVHMHIVFTGRVNNVLWLNVT